MISLKKIKQVIHGFIKFRPLLSELVKRDLKVRYRHSVLGMIWTVLNPLLSMIVLTIVFSNMFRMNIDNFPLYALIGNIVFCYNSESTTQSMNAIIWNSSLIKKVYIPKYLFPLSNVMSGLVNFGFSFIAMIIVMLFTGAPFYPTFITVWIPLVYLTLFAFGLSLILCSINVFFRDMQHLYTVFTTAWMYLSGVFYTIDIIPKEIRGIVEFNPMYQYISFFRTVIMDGVFPDLSHNLICIAWSLGMIIAGLLVFYKTQDKFILHI